MDGDFKNRVIKLFIVKRRYNLFYTHDLKKYGMKH